MQNQEVQTAMNEGLLCRRFYPKQEFRAAEIEGEKRLTGHPAVFDSATDIGGLFREVIARGAFDNCDMKDVLFFINHDSTKVPLARSRNNNGNSTMTLTIDDIGLLMDASVDVDNNQEARALYSAVQREDMTGMSFCFRVKEQQWENLDTGYPTRRITKIAKVYEVSAVNEPAYDDTDISARGAKEALESARRSLENARSKALDSAKELEVYKLKNKIMSY